MTTALYRRYRPETFADVIGQEHVTEPLMQALRSGRVNHAYLFSGPRGCGKTTSARILARCLNCEQGPTPEPCGSCESCVALARGGPGSIDVIEIDAASHGGVDDARDLRERAAFGPAQARYKVYIIDEAHMVTTHGFNALLKVVEEPPEHVKFIFATTEPEKVLSTIRSRTHHYPFHLVPPQRLTTYLEQLCLAEGVSLEQGVLSFVTRAGGGSVRDSLSVLDQLMAGAGSEGLTYDRTAALLGFTDVELLDAVVDAVAAGDAATVFTKVDRVMESGHDPRRFVEDLLERYRDLIVVSAVGERTGGLLRGLPEDQVARMRQQAGGYGPGSLTRCAEIISRGLSEMTGAVSFRMHLELICARLLLPGAEGESGYAARLDRIERRLAAGGPAPATAQPQAPPTRAATQPAAAQRQEPPTPAAAQPDSPPAAPAQPSPATAQAPAQRRDATAPGALDTAAVRRAWPEVLDRVKELRKVTWTLVSAATVLDFDGQRLVLGVATEGLANTFRQGQHAEVVRKALSQAIGLDTRVESVPFDGGETVSAGPGPAPARPAPSVAEQLGAVGGSRTAPAPDRSDWSARPRDPAPSWADPAAGPPAAGPPTAGPASAGPPTAEDSARSRSADAPTGPRGSDSQAGPRRSDSQTGRGGAPAGPPGAEASRHTAATRADPGGDEPSTDDEDLDSSGAVGQPVVESILGGRVIAVDDDPAR